MSGSVCECDVYAGTIMQHLGLLALFPISLSLCSCSSVYCFHSFEGYFYDYVSLVVCCLYCLINA